MRHWRLMIFVLGTATAGVAVAWYFAGSAPIVPFPRIMEHGQVVLLPNAAEQPRRGAKVVFDVSSESKPDEVNKGLDRAARLLNLYAAAGLAETDVRITLVFHGESTKAILTDKAYAERFAAETNPNLPLIRELKKAGIELHVCGQALHKKKYAADEVATEVTVAVSALTVIINKQSQGYVLMP